MFCQQPIIRFFIRLGLFFPLDPKRNLNYFHIQQKKMLSKA